MGHNGLNSHHQADYKHQHSRPDSTPGGNGRQGNFLFRQPAGHHRIDKIHTKTGHHTNHDRSRQLESSINLGRVIFVCACCVHWLQSELNPQYAGC